MQAQCFCAFSKYIAVSSRSGQVENKIFTVDFVDQKPVGSNVTFTTALVCPAQTVVFIFGGQLSFFRKYPDNLLKQSFIVSPFFNAFIIFLKDTMVFNRQHPNPPLTPQRKKIRGLNRLPVLSRLSPSTFRSSALTFQAEKG